MKCPYCKTELKNIGVLHHMKECPSMPEYKPLTTKELENIIKLIFTKKRKK